MTRTGKIARLPLDVRQELNVRLQNGETGREVFMWLNGLRRVKPVLKEHFDVQPVNDQNKSDWKRGDLRENMSVIQIGKKAAFEQAGRGFCEFLPDLEFKPIQGNSRGGGHEG